MMKYLLIAAMITFVACQPAQKKEKTILPSWNKGPAKESILKYLVSVSDPDSPAHVEVEDRIAVFDNDGTLWSEQPIYFQARFAADKLHQMMKEHPEWQNVPPYEWMLKPSISDYSMQDLMEMLELTHSGMTNKEFRAEIIEWADTSMHPRFERPYTELIYQPMQELISLLHKHEFKVYVVSGGGLEFMRALLPEVYGIEGEYFLGSSMKTSFKSSGDSVWIERHPEIYFIDDKEGKPVNIDRVIGKKPIFCAGNSDGDLAMMEYTASNELQSFMLYVHHTDSIREWAYDRASHIGRFDKGLDKAMEKDWLIVNMEKDWKQVFSFQ